MRAIYFKLLFRLKERADAVLLRPLRRIWWSMQGMHIGKGASFASLHVTWPHQVRIGDHCRLEHDVYFHYDGIYAPGPKIVIGDHCFIGSGCEFNISEGIEIGRRTLIASGSRFVDHNHVLEMGVPIAEQPCTTGRISVGEDVWVGAHAIILEGVEIGDGAVVAAGAVVTRSVPAYAIVAGVPAKIIRSRLESKVPARMLSTQ